MIEISDPTKLVAALMTVPLLATGKGCLNDQLATAYFYLERRYDTNERQDCAEQ